MVSYYSFHKLTRSLYDGPLIMTQQPLPAIQSPTELCFIPVISNTLLLALKHSIYHTYTFYTRIPKRHFPCWITPNLYRNYHSPRLSTQDLTLLTYCQVLCPPLQHACSPPISLPSFMSCSLPISALPSFLLSHHSPISIYLQPMSLPNVELGGELKTLEIGGLTVSHLLLPIA